MVALFVLIYLVCMLILAIICYIRSRRMKDREVVFSGPDSVTDPTQTEHGRQQSQPKYKNGVEIIPSEAEKIKKEQRESLVKKKRKTKKRKASGKKGDSSSK